MRMPKDTKPLIQGALVGAVVCAILGFSWGGWVTGETARKDAAVSAHDATVVALAPFCAERFLAQGDASARMAELAKASIWQRNRVLEKSGFAALPGSKTGEPDLAAPAPRS
jgi:alpha/beta superfamily hydrolase